MNKPNYYDGSGTLQPAVIAAAANNQQSKTDQPLHAPNIQDPDNKPNYYDGSGMLSFQS